MRTSRDVSLSDATGPLVSCVKHLGVHLTSTLSWSSHTTAILGKAAPLAGILRDWRTDVHLACIASLKGCIVLLCGLGSSTVLQSGALPVAVRMRSV